MSNVVDFNGGEVGDGYVIDPDSVLDGAKGELREVAVLGITKEGDLYQASSHGRPELFWLLELVKFHLLNEATS